MIIKIVEMEFIWFICWKIR